MSDWYQVKTFYGYKVSNSDDYTYNEFINILDGLNSILEEPFQFKIIIDALYLDIDLKEIFDNNFTTIIGFNIDNTDMLYLADNLNDYVTDNPILKGIDLSNTSQIYSGIDWFNNIKENDYKTDDDDDEDDDEYEYNDKYDDEYEYKDNED